MRYAAEVIELLAAFPGREWKMIEIVNHVARGRPSSKQLRNRYREGIRLVLLTLIDCGLVMRKPARPGGTPLYTWRESAKRDESKVMDKLP